MEYIHIKADWALGLVRRKKKGERDREKKPAKEAQQNFGKKQIGYDVLLRRLNQLSLNFLSAWDYLWKLEMSDFNDMRMFFQWKTWVQ